MTDIIIPSSPTDLDKLNKMIRELVNSKYRQQAETDYQKEAIKDLEEKYEIKAKYLRQMVNDSYKNSFSEKVAEMSEYEGLYEAVMNRKVSKDEEESE